MVRTALPIEVLCTLAAGGTAHTHNWSQSGVGAPIAGVRTFIHEEEKWAAVGSKVMEEQHKKHLLLEAALAIQARNFQLDGQGIAQPAVCGAADGVFAKRCV